MLITRRPGVQIPPPLPSKLTWAQQLRLSAPFLLDGAAHHGVTMETLKHLPILIASRCLNGEVVSTAHILSIIRTFFPLCAVSFMGLDSKTSSNIAQFFLKPPPQSEKNSPFLALAPKKSGKNSPFLALAPPLFQGVLETEQLPDIILVLKDTEGKVSALVELVQKDTEGRTSGLRGIYGLHRGSGR